MTEPHSLWLENNSCMLEMTANGSFSRVPRASLGSATNEWKTLYPANVCKSNYPP